MLAGCCLRFCSFALEQYLDIYKLKARISVTAQTWQGIVETTSTTDVHIRVNILRGCYCCFWTNKTKIRWTPRFSVRGAAVTLCGRKAFVSNSKLLHFDLSITTFLYVRWGSMLLFQLENTQQQGCGIHKLLIKRIQMQFLFFYFALVK